MRSVYRVAEYTAGANSDLAHSEVAFYLLDAVPMLLFVLTFVIIWPPNVFESHTVRPDIHLPARSTGLKREPESGR